MSRRSDYFSQDNKSIYLLRERDFGEVLNDAITFLKGMGGQFYRVILFTIVPISLLNGIFLGFFLSDANSIFTAILEHGDTMTSPLAIFTSWAYIGAILLGLFESIAIVVVVHSFFKLYNQGIDNIEVGMVWSEIAGHIFNVFVGLVSLVVVMVFIFVIAGGIMGVSASVFGSGAGLFIAFVVIMLVFLGTIYLTLVFSMVLPAIVLEDIWAIEAIRRSVKLVSQNWGQTFLVLMVAYIAIGLMGLVFNIPSLVVQWFTSLNSLDISPEGGSVQEGVSSFWVIFGTCVAAVGSALTSPIIHIVITIQYFNLRERLEGTGIKSLIDSFGSAESSVEDEDEDW